MDRLIEALRKARERAESTARGVFQTKKTNLISPVPANQVVPKTRPVLTAAKNFTSGVVESTKQFYKPVKEFGGQLGKALVSPYDRRLEASYQKTLQEQSRRNLEASRKLAAQGKADAAKRLLQRNLAESQARSARSAQISRQAAEDESKTKKLGVQTAIRTAQSIYGIPRLAANAGTTALGLVLGGTIEKLQGGSFAKGAGKAVPEVVKTLAVTKFTDPRIEKVVNALKIKPGLARQLAYRGVTGAGNVAEDEIISRLDDQKVTPAQRALSFGIGTVVSPKANDEVVKRVVQIIKKFPDRFKAPEVKAKEPTGGVRARGSNQYQPKYKEAAPGAPRRSDKFVEIRPGRFVREGYKPTREFGREESLAAIGGLEVERDEQGNFKTKFSPEKAALAIGLTSGIKSKAGRDLLEKAVKAVKPEGLKPGAEKIPQTIQQSAKQVSLKGPDPAPLNKYIPDTPEAVAATLPDKIDNFVQRTLGYSIKAPEGGTKGASLYTRTLRRGQEAVSRSFERGLASEKPAVRTAAQTMQGFFKGLGESPERAKAASELRGGISSSNQRAYDVMNSLYETVGKNQKSLERINAVLDPELAGFKLDYKDLTPDEQKTHDLIRSGLDLVHDTSFANGHISSDLYKANKGKYVPRLYEPFELPEEVNQFVNSSTRKLQTDLYKSRKSVEDWKIDNSLNDPVYALGKRMAQVETNKAIKGYTDFLASRPNLVSDVERPGFTKLSDSKAYGALSGKYVLNSASEELKGFFFSNQGLQNLYDAFRAFDRLPIRQLQKKVLTVFNPTTNVGNIVSDNVFGFMTGVDPLTLNRNIVKFRSNRSEFKQLSDYLLRSGVTGTDITRTDFTDKLSEIDALAKGVRGGGKNVITKGAEAVQRFYGGTDDVYKVAAFKSLLDQGKSLEEATQLVKDGFQNYANVGKFYDIWAKTPAVGSAFIKFQGDLIRIVKNAAINRPLHLVTFLATLKATAFLFSKVSGESDKDRKTRESRAFAPVIPGLNIPLTWQTPYGEINAARYISPFFANNYDIGRGGTSVIRKQLPFMPELVRDRDGSLDVASSIAKSVNDPLLAPLVQTFVDRDFRGKPISDPAMSKYRPSTLTSGEKLSNRAKFLLRSYTPPLPNTVTDVAAAARGEKDYYGRTRTLPQAVARAAGVKVEQFGPEEAQAQRERDAMFAGYEQDYLKGNIRNILNDAYSGTVDFETAFKRIQAQQENGENAYRQTAEALYAKLKDMPKDDRGAAYSRVSNYLDDKTKQEIYTIQKLEKIGLVAKDRQLLFVPEEVRARQVYERLLELSAKNRLEKYQQLVKAGVITDSMKPALFAFSNKR